MSHKIVVTLAEDDLLELKAVLIDEDAPAALEFLRDRLVPKIPAQGQGNCDSTRLNPFLIERRTGRR